MTPEKLENQLREALGKREAQPSAGSWEKLAARLDAVQKPARPRNRAWVYLAAAALLLLLGLRLLLPANGEPAPGGVVAGPRQPDTDSPAASANPSADTEAVVLELPERKAGGNGPATPETAVVAVSLPDAQPARVKAALAGPEPMAPASPDTTGLHARIDAGLASVLETVAGLEAGQGPVTDAAIDSLLRAAQAAIARQQYGQPRDEVDAMALLSAAEEELDQSFREQIFDRLKTGFDRVRTAVAARND